ncbi:hypothetical protein JRT83AECX_JRT83AEC_04112 [Escherichia coli]|nr:hypothetical protein JRT83AECX_JRT83AEC_04112 [Escherichia coli]
MTIIGDEIPLISEKQSLSKVLLNDENNELSDGTNFWDKNRQLTTDEIACYLQKIAAKEGANKRGNSSRLTQSFHFFMFEPFFLP